MNFLMTVASEVPETPDPPVTCTYALTASAAQLATLGYAGKLTMDATQQIGTYTVASGLGAARSYAAATDLASPQLWDFSSGKHAFRVNLTTPAIVGGAGQVDTVALLINSTQTRLVRLTVQAKNTGLFSMLIDDQAGNVKTLTGLTEAPSAAVFLLDSTGATFALYLHYPSDPSGTFTLVTGMSRNTFTAGNNYILLEQVGESTAVNAGNAGHQYVVELDAAASSMSSSYLGSGVTDPCGNAIGA